MAHAFGAIESAAKNGNKINNGQHKPQLPMTSKMMPQLINDLPNSSADLAAFISGWNIGLSSRFLRPTAANNSNVVSGDSAR